MPARLKKMPENGKEEGNVLFGEVFHGLERDNSVQGREPGKFQEIRIQKGCVRDGGVTSPDRGDYAAIPVATVRVPNLPCQDDGPVPGPTGEVPDYVLCPEEARCESIPGQVVPLIDVQPLFDKGTRKIYVDSLPAIGEPNPEGPRQASP